MALCTELEKMSLLRSLRIDAVSEEEVLELQSMSAPLPLLQSLYLSGRLEKLPEWFSKLKSIVRIGLQWSGLMDDPLKVLEALPNLVELAIHKAYGGEQLHIEEGGIQKLKILIFKNFERLNRLIIDEGALPLLENLEIGSSPQLKEVPSGIADLKNLKNIDFCDMPTEFVLSLQPDEGHNFGEVKHVASVCFWYRIHGQYYEVYKLGESELLERLRR